MSGHAHRQRRYRLRQISGQAVLSVTVDFNDVVTALIASGRLTEDQAFDRGQVEVAVATVVGEWARRWRE